MKTSLRSLLIGSALLAVPQIASATLLVGFHDFDGTLNTAGSPMAPHGPDTASGFSAGIIETVASSETGGSTDTFLGESAYGQGTDAFNDGYAKIQSTVSPGLTVQLTNSTGSSYTLGRLYFDMVSTTPESPAKGVSVSYQITGTGPIGTFTDVYYIADAQADYSDFRPFIVDGSGDPLVLGNGQTIDFFFTMVGAISELRIDNIGIDGTLTAIPEPGSMLALGGIVGSGALLRRRRRLA